MMDDLFSYTPSPRLVTSQTYEDIYREAIKAQVKISDRIVRQRGIYPDWLGEPEPLSKDKARLLTYLYEEGFFQWTSSTSPNNRKVVLAIGLNQEANAKAVIQDCHALDLISSRIYDGRKIFELTHKGEQALHEYLLEQEIMNMDYDEESE